MDEGTGTHLSFQHLSEEAEPFPRLLLKTATTGKQTTTHFSALRGETGTDYSGRVSPATPEAEQTYIFRPQDAQTTTETE